MHHSTKITLQNSTALFRCKKVKKGLYNLLEILISTNKQERGSRIAANFLFTFSLTNAIQLILFNTALAFRSRARKKFVFIYLVTDCAQFFHSHAGVNISNKERVFGVFRNNMRF